MKEKMKTKNPLSNDESNGLLSNFLQIQKKWLRKEPLCCLTL